MSDTTATTAPAASLAPFNAEVEINDIITALTDHLVGVAMSGGPSPEAIPDYRYPCDGAFNLIPRSLHLIAAWARDALNVHDGVVGPRFVLGSQDAEMAWIEKRLRNAGLTVFFGAVYDRRVDKAVRVAPGQTAEGVLDVGGRHTTGAYMPQDYSLIPIEVTVEIGEDTITPIIDHHAPTDARTNAPPHLAWIASSAGQVAYILANAGGAWTDRDTAEAVLVGESDHNLPAFCAGRCFTPPELARRYALVTRWQTFGAGVPWADFCAAVEQSERTLRYYLHYKDPEAAGYYADLTDLAVDGRPAAGTGEVYPAVAQYLPLVSSLCGIPYVVRIRRRDGKLALRLGGFAPGAWALRDFAAHPTSGAWGCLPADAPAPNNAYCFVERGMGGGTLIDQEDRGISGDHIDAPRVIGGGAAGGAQ